MNDDDNGIPVTLTREQARMLVTHIRPWGELTRAALESLRDQLKPPIIEPTPGPWVVDVDDTMTVRGPDGKLIADTLFVTMLISKEEARANARLICEAPEMYDLLRDVSGGEPGVDYGEGSNADRAFKLVARIRGES